jgi:hypothetical protein
MIYVFFFVDAGVEDRTINLQTRPSGSFKSKRMLTILV